MKREIKITYTNDEKYSYIRHADVNSENISFLLDHPGDFLSFNANGKEYNIRKSLINCITEESTEE